MFSLHWGHYSSSAGQQRKGMDSDSAHTVHSSRSRLFYMSTVQKHCCQDTKRQRLKCAIMWVWVRNYLCAGSMTRWRSPVPHSMTSPQLQLSLLGTEDLLWEWGNISLSILFSIFYTTLTSSLYVLCCNYRDKTWFYIDCLQNFTTIRETYLQANTQLCPKISTSSFNSLLFFSVWESCNSVDS